MNGENDLEQQCFYHSLAKRAFSFNAVQGFHSSSIRNTETFDPLQVELMAKILAEKYSCTAFSNTLVLFRMSFRGS